MGFNCGILGLPNVGKSTLFNALTSTQSAESANYPFCTIEPNIGVVSVPDKRLEIISEISNSKKIIYNQLEFVDIAGLVKGANKGEGLGNKFLDNLSKVDAYIHMVRCFDDKKITHVSSDLNPSEDIKTIETELLLSDLSKAENIVQNYLNKNKGSKIDPIIKDTLNTIKKKLEEGIQINEINLDIEQKRIIKDYNFLTNKPYLFVCNVDEDSIINGNEFSWSVKNYASSKEKKIINVSASIESEIALIEDEKERNDFLKSLKLNETSLSKLIRTGYQILDLITFFTSGENESKAWTCKNGTLAPQAGAKIHTDFEKGFIKVETIGYEEFIKFKGETGCKLNGKIRQEGKDYVVKDGDILNFKFNV
mgnify:CR=1 FL=1|tara:strand:- start:2241 stop:3338 length:1098 start_codon:yes stop_codon:yes gene_type:complete